jgi:hypothetical protein
MSFCELISPDNGVTVPILTYYQRQFNSAHTESEKRSVVAEMAKINGHCNACSEDETTQEAAKQAAVSLDTRFKNFTYPLPVSLIWRSDRDESILEISETPDFSICRRYLVKGYKKDVYNLKIGTKYFWRVSGSEIYIFFTENALPRWIYAENLTNIRDLGGYLNCSGRRIRQGLLFRGAKIEGWALPEGIEMLRELGIRTQIDLRAEVVGLQTESPLGQEVRYENHPCGAYDEFILCNDPCAIRQLVTRFTDPNIYPVYFHCYGGADRTGTLAFMLGVILGLDEATLLDEYEQTLLSALNPDMRRSRWGELFQRLVKALDRPEFGSGDLCVKSMRFLESIGVTQHDVDSIRNILLE